MAPRCEVLHRTHSGVVPRSPSESAHKAEDMRLRAPLANVLRAVKPVVFPDAPNDGLRRAEERDDHKDRNRDQHSEGQIAEEMVFQLPERSFS